MSLLCEDGSVLLKEDGDNLLWADASQGCGGAGFGGGGMVR